MKIAILGFSGSGKSTLARYLSNTLKLPVLHLDTVQFTSGWQERERSEAKAIVASFLEKDDWIIEGNYGSFYQKERLEQADCIFILTFSRWASLRRVIARRIKYHNQTRPDMAPGCVEKIDRDFLRWILYEVRSADKQQHFAAIAQNYPEKTHVIKNQRQLDAVYQRKS